MGHHGLPEMRWEHSDCADRLWGMAQVSWVRTGVRTMVSGQQVWPAVRIPPGPARTDPGPICPGCRLASILRHVPSGPIGSNQLSESCYKSSLLMSCRPYPSSSIIPYPGSHPGRDILMILFRTGHQCIRKASCICLFRMSSRQLLLRPGMRSIFPDAAFKWRGIDGVPDYRITL